MKRAALLLLLLPMAASGQVTVTIGQANASTNAAPANASTNAAPAKSDAATGSTIEDDRKNFDKQLDNIIKKKENVRKASGLTLPVTLKNPVPIVGQRVQQAIRVINGPGGQVINFGGNGFFPGGSSTSASSAPAVPTLYWKNGERLGGELAGGSDADVAWKSALFDDPLQLKWSAVDRIEWPENDAAKPGGQFSVALRDGSFIYGDLVSLGGGTITIRSPHHGDVALKRSEVLSVRRIKRGDLIFAGPTGNVGWQGLMVQQTGNMVRNPFGFTTDSAITTGPGGAVRINAWNRCGLFDIDLPHSVDVEFRLHSSARPAFSFALGGNLSEPMRIETWDDELVLVERNRFKAIRKLDLSERQIALRLCWDINSRKCLVYTLDGNLITEWNVPGDVMTPDTGIVLENKGRDLSLDFLRVRAWDGKPPAKTDPRQPHIELADGHDIAGALLAGAPGSIKVQAGQGTPADYPIDKIDALVFSTDIPQETTHAATLVYADGATVQGSIASISPGETVIATSFAAAPLPCKLDAPRLLVVHAPAPKETAPPLDQMDQITLQSTTLHGKLDTNGGHTLLWMPIGGVKPSRPSAAEPIEITRALPPAAPLSADSALFYMTSGDVLPGVLHSLDRTGAEIDSGIISATKIPAVQLNAIQFNTSSRVDVKSFGDPGWHIVKGDADTVHFDGGSVDINPGGAIEYPGLMAASQIQFKYASSAGFSSMRLSLFSSGADTAHAMNILIGNTGGQFICSQESSSGQFMNQTQVRTNPGEPVTVRLVIRDDDVEVLANDLSVQHFPIDPASLSGSGLTIAPGSMWGNTLVPVSLSGFSAASGYDRSWLPQVSSDVKMQVLTVPRFEKDDPPKHVLIASNGDVLRGEVEAATDSHFAFRTGLDTLNVPRERVQAVICLKPPDDSKAAAPLAIAPNPLSVRLQGRAMFGQIDLASLVGYIQGQNPNLKIRFTDTQLSHPGMIQIGEETVGQALQTICSRFNLHYHLDDDGAIVLEQGDESSALPSKSYWLNPGALPASASARETLAAKGITFGQGATVQWQPDTGLLTMSNTAGNQAKLAALVNSDFGGSLGSPTHWLMLTDGSRFSLAVDNFGADFITGHHPIYGAIKIPVAEVCAIRTTPPGPTPAARLLDGWRLVNAPEPVIPQPGGDDSALLGKDAPGFTAPLLDGGDFALASEKGSVVVLDFWASWCQPCVQSLPGLVGAVSQFPAGHVKLVGVDQGEAPEQVRRFLTAKNLKFTVALDADQSVGRKYGADAIPHTVVVGPDGKIAFVQTGYDPDADTAIADTIKRLLNPAPSKPPTTTAPQ